MTAATFTSPVEATLRILINSVPFLMGAAVVRQPPGSEGVVASVGRMPWLHDRRLTTLQLPDDTLPSNRAVALDWPVPFQAEWVGAPPRLLISRLVFQGRTVGVLLGTLISREPINHQTREALDLAGELIASAVAGLSAFAMAAQEAPPEIEQRVIEPAPRPVERAPQDMASATVAASPAVQEREARPEPERRDATEPRMEPEPARADVGPPPPEPELPPLPPAHRGAAPREWVVEEAQKGLAAATDARSLGRVLRDAMSVITEASSFSVALFHRTRPEVAYRYKVVGPDRDSAELGRQHVDDGPACYAARHDRRWHVFAREIAIREFEPRIREVIVLQLPMSTAGDVFGIVTVQTFRPEGFTDQELRLVATVVEAASPHFADVRAEGRFQPVGAPAAGEPGAATVLEPARTQTPPHAPPAARGAEHVLRDLLRRCASAGFPTAFLMGVDPGAAALRGELVSDADAAREVDYALGISSGKFSVPLDDRYNAIARSVREARIVPAPTVYEITRPAMDFDAAQAIERLAKGGRSVTLPLLVNGEAAGALVLGPMREEPSFFAIEAIRGYVDDASKELASLWRPGA
ncbi:MAG TPA: GAF domain-containing protein [Candidatus Limnocylindrales bacterium]|nr:GAF domain-containing protein [Candidatus Limnocylindrales bacterium]